MVWIERRERKNLMIRGSMEINKRYSWPNNLYKGRMIRTQGFHGLSWWERREQHDRLDNNLHLTQMKGIYCYLYLLTIRKKGKITSPIRDKIRMDSLILKESYTHSLPKQMISFFAVWILYWVLINIKNNVLTSLSMEIGRNISHQCQLPKRR